MVTRGYYMILVDLRGHTPPTSKLSGQKGEPVRPRVRRGPVNPNNKKKVRVLGKVCGHLASASELLLGRSGVRARASRGRVWPISPNVQKCRGYIPI